MVAMKAAGRTVIVVTHRPQLLAFVDSILVMSSGTMLAFGERDGVIARMRGQKAVIAHDAAATRMGSMTARTRIRNALVMERG